MQHKTQPIKSAHWMHQLTIVNYKFVNLVFLQLLINSTKKAENFV